MAAAVARTGRRLSSPRGARRDSRRPLRRWFLGRAIRVAGGDRRLARNAAKSRFRPMDLAFGGGSIEPCWNHHAGAESAGADRQSRDLPGRRSRRRLGRRRRGIADRTRRVNGMGGEEAADPLGVVGNVGGLGVTRFRMDCTLERSVIASEAKQSFRKAASYEWIASSLRSLQ